MLAKNAAMPIWTGDRVDPTRTGFLDLSMEPECGMWGKALAADVLVCRRDGSWYPGQPGFSYADWTPNGHPRWGWPDADDLRYHLTTLFPEVRPRRGTLELRSPDSVPLRLLPAVVVLVSAVVYDTDAGMEVLRLLAGHDPDDLWKRAAFAGPHDPGVARLASRVWDAALVAARRMPDDINPQHFDAAGHFVERAVDPLRSPSEELRRTQRSGVKAGLDWATADS